MTRTVYFADKAVTFTDETPVDVHCAVLAGRAEAVSRDKILKILETHNCAAVVGDDPQAAFASFAAEFIPVEAAGGIVVDDCGKWLMIHRNGRWDFPKGHLECNETIEQCAAREVAEETGVAGVEFVRHLCDTLHAYDLYGKWELKRTHWYEFRISSCLNTAPQVEEGIDCVAWCSPAEVEAHLRAAFPTIRRVAEAMKDDNCQAK